MTPGNGDERSSEERPRDQPSIDNRLTIPWAEVPLDERIPVAMRVGRLAFLLARRVGSRASRESIVEDTARLHDVPTLIVAIYERHARCAFEQRVRNRRNRRIWRLACAGRSNREIAERARVSEVTVGRVVRRCIAERWPIVSGAP